jgi:hypothetical protein
MKKLVLFIFLNLMLCNAVFADEVEDLEIEGISISDSLLLHIEKAEIKKEIEINKSNYSYLDNNMFGEVYVYSDKFKIYDYLSFFVKPSDDTYFIYSIYGTISYDKNIDECIKKQKEITKEFSLSFPDAIKYEGEMIHRVDQTGRSKIYYNYFELKNGDFIKTECTEFEKGIKEKNNWINGLNVVLSKKEVHDWMSSTN